MLYICDWASTSAQIKHVQKAVHFLVTIYDKVFCKLYLLSK